MQAVTEAVLGVRVHRREHGVVVTEPVWFSPDFGDTRHVTGLFDHSDVAGMTGQQIAAMWLDSATRLDQRSRQMD